MTSASALGSAGAESLDADLPELPHPALLRPLVAEHRAGVVELREGPLRNERVFERGSHDARGSLRSQGEAASRPVVEGVHLLRDDVGRLADASREDVGVLEERRVDGFVPVAREQVLRDPKQVLPRARNVGEHVCRAFGRACVHGAGLPIWGVCEVACKAGVYRERFGGAMSPASMRVRRRETCRVRAGVQTPRASDTPAQPPDQPCGPTTMCD